jgi:hypothetical protein
MEFTLNLIDQEATEELANALFENKFGDALLYKIDKKVYLSFERDSIEQTIKELELINIKSQYVQESQ